MYGLHLERLLDSEQSRRLFVAAIDAAVGELENFGKIIPAATLNAHLGTPASRFGDMAVEKPRSFLERIREFADQSSGAPDST
jgi:hypothetical protein